MRADGSRTTLRKTDGIVVVEDFQHQRFESELEALQQKDLKPEDSAPVSITIKLKPEANQRPERNAGATPVSPSMPSAGVAHP
jgi:hypothetical protein